MKKRTGNSEQMKQLKMYGNNPSPLERWATAEYFRSLCMARRSMLRPAGGRRATDDYVWAIMSSADDLLDKRLGSIAVNRKTGKDFKFDQWVNVRLTDEDKAEIENIINLGVNHEILLSWLSGLAYAGYSVSFAWDDWSDAQQVSLVCKDYDDPNYGLGMSARHPDLDIAIVTLQYKHENICSRKWADVAPSPGGNGWG